MPPDVAISAGTSMLQRVSLQDLATADLPPVRFVLAPLLPRGVVTLLGGHGDAGKSLLALSWAVHAAVGRRWGPHPVITGRTLLVSLEDDAALVRLRLRRCAEAHGIDPADVASAVTLLVADADASLATEANEHGVRSLITTTGMDELRDAAPGHDLIVLDNASDAFDANENDRRMVRRFVRELAAIARDADAAVLLLAHIDKAAARNGAAGNAYSGSTAWHNSVRSRLALVATDGGAELRHEKSNLTAKAQPVTLTRTDHGVPLVAGGRVTAATDADDDAEVLAAIMTAHQRGTSVGTGRAGPGNTRLVLRTFDLPAELGADSDRFWRAINRLEHSGRITREQYRTHARNAKERYIPCPRNAAVGVRCNTPHTPHELTHAGGRVSS